MDVVYDVCLSVCVCAGSYSYYSRSVWLFLLSSVYILEFVNFSCLPISFLNTQCLH